MTETQRLYYEDVYIREFQAQVLACQAAGKGYAILLDRSAFYPEGGGQPSDQGVLDSVKVTEVRRTASLYRCTIGTGDAGHRKDQLAAQI